MGSPTEWSNQSQKVRRWKRGTRRLHFLPTVVMGRRLGMIPNEYWKIPRPLMRTGARPMIFCRESCRRRTREPTGLLTWSNTSFSPKEKLGTRWAPFFRARRTNPLRRDRIKLTVDVLGLVCRDSGAPPTTTTTAWPLPRLDSTYSMLARDAVTEPLVMKNSR